MIDANFEKESIVPRLISKEQSQDTGMAIVLVFLLIGVIWNVELLIRLSIPILIINMIFPTIYKPIAKVWFGFSHILGTVTSKIILTIIFFVLVTPIGLLRNLCGFDSLQLKKWKNGRTSVFKVRDHKFTADDIIKPY